MCCIELVFYADLSTVLLWWWKRVYIYNIIWYTNTYFLHIKYRILSTKLDRAKIYLKTYNPKDSPLLFLDNVGLLCVTVAACIERDWSFQQINVNINLKITRTNKISVNYFNFKKMSLNSQIWVKDHLCTKWIGIICHIFNVDLKNKTNYSTIVVIYYHEGC